MTEFDHWIERWQQGMTGWHRTETNPRLLDHATDSLPDAFLLIPDGKPYSVVRASVPGTSDSDEARLQASIPTTARVERKGPTVNVTYFGEPKFEPIKPIVSNSSPFPVMT